MVRWFAPHKFEYGTLELVLFQLRNREPHLRPFGADFPYFSSRVRSTGVSIIDHGMPIPSNTTHISAEVKIDENRMRLNIENGP